MGDVIDLQSGPRNERHEVKHMESKRESEYMREVKRVFPSRRVAFHSDDNARCLSMSVNAKRH